MNRIVTMVLNNFWRVPGAWFKLCHYAKYTEKYIRESGKTSAGTFIQTSSCGTNKSPTIVAPNDAKIPNKKLV